MSKQASPLANFAHCSITGRVVEVAAVRRTFSAARRRRRSCAVAALVLGALTACRDTTMPLPFPLPSDATEFTAPTIYRVWWSEVERCSGRTARLSGMR